MSEVVLDSYRALLCLSVVRDKVYPRIAVLRTLAALDVQILLDARLTREEKRAVFEEIARWRETLR